MYSKPRSKKLSKISVVIRKRPINRKELARNEQDIIEIRGRQTVAVRELKTKVDLTKYIEEHTYIFDGAVQQEVNNEQLYDQYIYPLVEATLQGVKSTCFAYGQTGSGKTYTMMGDSAVVNNDSNRIPGLYILACKDLLEGLQTLDKQYDVWIAFYEIYCGKLHDLLNDRKQLFAREDGKNKVNIVGLQEKRVETVQEIMELIHFGSSVRVVGTTGANLDSSRSHAICQINVKYRNKDRVFSKLSFIDLAGSERAKDVIDQNKQTRIDGAEINKSLLALKECIRAIDQEKRHLPFRGSKLTMVLKDSFLGNCKTVMIGCVSPNSLSCEHTLNTLRYADRVKELKNANDKGDEMMLARQNRNVKRYKIGKNYMNKQKNYNDYDDENDDEDQLISHGLFENLNGNKKTKQKNKRINKGNLLNLPKQKNLGQQVQQQKESSFKQKVRNLKQNTVQLLNKQMNNQTPSTFGNFQHLTKRQIDNWTINNEQELQTMSNTHEQLISQILAEEEEVISSHRQHIDDVVELTKEEMMLLHDVDKPGSDIEEYLDSLDAILAHKNDIITHLSQKIKDFRNHLREEEYLSKKFYSQRAKILNNLDQQQNSNQQNK